MSWRIKRSWVRLMLALAIVMATAGCGSKSSKNPTQPIVPVVLRWTVQITGASSNGVWGSSANDIFAVGVSGTIRHYNGTAWASMASGTSQYLAGVWGSAANNVFAVGDGGTILKYNGTAWGAQNSGVTR